MILASPYFLIALVAVAIPIAVHLFNFRRYRKVYFSNVQRLEQLQTETRRQSRLRELLILAARILAIVFLVLAFAQPVVPKRESSMCAGGSNVSIYVDNSFSMDNTDGNITLLEKARTKAREIVAAYGPTDRFQIVSNEMEGRQFHWLSKDEALLAIDELQTSAATLSISDIARRQFDFLHNGTSGNRFAYFVSDFQTSISDFADFPNDSTISSVFVPLEAKSINNVSIDSLSLNAPVFYKGNSVTAEVWLSNHGDENLEKVPLTLFVNGRQKALASVDLPARSEMPVEMHFTVDEGGTQAAKPAGNSILSCRIETTDYPITFDDRYFFSLNIREHIRMLTIEGVSQNEYLQRLFAGDSAVIYSSLPLSQMNPSRIDGNDIVLLDELPSLSTGLAQTLHTFVENGGTLVIVPNDRSETASYNEALSLFAAPHLSSIVSGRTTASAIGFDNRLYRNVFSKAVPDDLEMPSVSGYFRLATGTGTIANPVITLANGDSYLVEVPCGSGRLYLFAAALRDANTDFMRQAMFVPTLYNMALYSVRPTLPSNSLGSSDPVTLANLYDATDGAVSIVSAGTEKDPFAVHHSGNQAIPQSNNNIFEAIPDIRRTASSCVLVPHGTVREAGNYLIRQDGADIEGLSFNYSRLESQMDFLGRDAITTMLKNNNLHNCSVIRNADKPLDSYLKEQLEGRQLWRWCILLSLLMILAEILLIRLPVKR